MTNRNWSDLKPGDLFVFRLKPDRKHCGWNAWFNRSVDDAAVLRVVEEPAGRLCGYLVWEPHPVYGEAGLQKYTYGTLTKLGRCAATDLEASPYTFEKIEEMITDAPEEEGSNSGTE